MSMRPPAAGRAELGIEALELFIAVLSQAEPDEAGSDSFYDRLSEAVCRLAGMRRAIIFRYDATMLRVRAVGAHGMDAAPFAGAHVTVESAPIAARALAEDRVIEVDGDATGQVPAEFATLVAEPARLVCAPMAAAGRAIGVILTDRTMDAPPLQDADRYLLWTLGKAAALAAVVRIFSAQNETARQLQQRIDLAREIHEGVIQRLFGVSMALDGDGGARPLRGRDPGRARGAARRVAAPARPRPPGDRDHADRRGAAPGSRPSRSWARAPGRRGGAGRPGAVGAVGAARGCAQRPQARGAHARRRARA